MARRAEKHPDRRSRLRRCRLHAPRPQPPPRESRPPHTLGLWRSQIRRRRQIHAAHSAARLIHRRTFARSDRRETVRGVWRPQGMASTIAERCSVQSGTTAPASLNERSRRTAFTGWCGPTRRSSGSRSARMRCARPPPPTRSITRPTSPKSRSGSGTPISPPPASTITGGRGRRTVRRSRLLIDVATGPSQRHRDDAARRASDNQPASGRCRRSRSDGRSYISHGRLRLWCHSAMYNSRAGI